MLTFSCDLSKEEILLYSDLLMIAQLLGNHVSFH